MDWNFRYFKMKNIGSYKGKKCYACNEQEYINVLKNGTDGDNIFIIDETMVYHNIIIGYYDGSRVKDVYDNKEYYKQKEKRKKEKKNEPVKENVEAETAELVLPDIHFEDYTTVVDEFFKELVANE